MNRYQGYQAEYLKGKSDRDYYHDYDLGTGTAMRSDPGLDRLQGFSGRGPKGWKRSDERLYEDACEALAESPLVDASGVSVSVEAQVIILKGTVENRRMKVAAEECVEFLAGVEDVRNELRIESHAS